MPLVKSFRPGQNVYCRSERNVLIRAKQYISSQTKIITIKCFVRDERDSTTSNISSGYNIIYSVFGTRKFCETIYFVFHFIITQHRKKSLCMRQERRRSICPPPGQRIPLGCHAYSHIALHPHIMIAWYNYMWVNMNARLVYIQTTSHIEITTFKHKFS